MYDPRPLGRLAAARAVFLDLLEQSSDNSPFTDDAHYWAGRIAYEEGDLEGARTRLERFLQLFEIEGDPMTVSGYYYLGMAYHDRGDRRIGSRYLRHAATYNGKPDGRKAADMLSGR